MTLARRIGLGIVFSWFFFGGVGHFVAMDFFTSIVPPWAQPWAVEAVIVSGIFEIAGAFGVLYAPTRRLAGWGLILLTLAVTPANVHMWLHPELFPYAPPAVLTARLFIQMALLWCIWWSTKPVAKPAR